MVSWLTPKSAASERRLLVPARGHGLWTLAADSACEPGQRYREGLRPRHTAIGHRGDGGGSSAQVRYRVSSYEAGKKRKRSRARGADPCRFRLKDAALDSLNVKKGAKLGCGSTAATQSSLIRICLKSIRARALRWASSAARQAAGRSLRYTADCAKMPSHSSASRSPSRWRFRFSRRSRYSSRFRSPNSNSVRRLASCVSIRCLRYCYALKPHAEAHKDDPCRVAK